MLILHCYNNFNTIILTLDVRLKRFAEEKSELQEEINKLRQQLNDTKHKGRRSGSLNGPLDDDEYEDAQSTCFSLIFFFTIFTDFFIKI